jgi:hypothetical protein
MRIPCLIKKRAGLVPLYLFCVKLSNFWQGSRFDSFLLIFAGSVGGGGILTTTLLCLVWILDVTLNFMAFGLTVFYRYMVYCYRIKNIYKHCIQFVFRFRVHVEQDGGGCYVAQIIQTYIESHADGSQRV